MIRHKTLRKHYLVKHYYKSNKKKTRTKRITKRQKIRGGDTYKALNLMKDTALGASRRFYDETKRQLNNTGSMFDPIGTFIPYRGPDGLRPGYDKDGELLPYDRDYEYRTRYDSRPGHINETIGKIIAAPYNITKGLINAPRNIMTGTQAVVKAYKTSSDKNIADIVAAMEWFDKNLKRQEVLSNQFWKDESTFLEGKINELENNKNMEGPIYDIARDIKQTIEGQNNLKNDITQIPKYSTLRLKYLPHIKPLILSLHSSDEPNIKLEKFKIIKQHIDELLVMISTVEKASELDTPSTDAIWHFNDINGILNDAIAKLELNSRPLEEQVEGVQQEIAGETNAVGGKRRLRKSRKLKSRY